MGSKTRLSYYCTKRANNGVNLVTSRKINTRLARPIARCQSDSYYSAKSVARVINSQLATILIVRVLGIHQLCFSIYISNGTMECKL